MKAVFGSLLFVCLSLCPFCDMAQEGLKKVESKMDTERKANRQVYDGKPVPAALRVETLDRNVLDEEAKVGKDPSKSLTNNKNKQISSKNGK